jgi:Lar family restriction alleviation protein
MTATNVSDELEPCPFCGADGSGYDDAAHGHSVVYCTDCLAEGPEGPDDASAADRWNRRATLSPPLPSTGVERLREALTWFVRHGPSLEADIRSAHRARGNGASEAMHDDDRDFRLALGDAIERGQAALSALPLDGGLK